VQVHGLTTEFAERVGNRGITWAFVNAIFPNVKVMSKAAITAIVISHGNGGCLLRVEIVESETKQSWLVTSTSKVSRMNNRGKGKLYWDGVIVRC
jgi:hypothetical protein